MVAPERAGAMHSIRLTAVVRSVLLAASLLPGSGFAESAQLSAEQASVLAVVRAQSLEYTHKLPDFICTQKTYRETTGFNTLGAAINENRLLATDVIEEKLTYFHHQESYEVVAINLKKVTGVQHTQVAGAISTGEFGSLLHDIFDPASDAVFSWNRMEKLRGRKSYVFAFQVPSAAGIHVSDKISKQEITASYRGLIFVDAETKQVLRITTHIDLPPKFEMKLAERTVDYRPSEIAGKTYILPFHSELQMQDTSYIYVNKIDFKDYHKFAVESTVTYSNAPPAPAQQPPPAQMQTTQTPANPADVASAQQTPDRIATPTASAMQEPPSTIDVGQPQSPPPPQPSTVSTTNAPAPTQVASATPNPSPPTSPNSQLADALSVASQSPPPLPTSAADTNFRLQVNVNEVLVPVVVRDPQDHAVGNLIKDDFELFDRNKLQDIKSFSIESHAIPSRQEAAAATPMQSTERRPANNYIVYLFDDLHLNAADLAQVRDAAGRNMDTLLQADRAAIFTTSGRLMLDFTIDRAQLHGALSKLQPHPLGGTHVQECPDISYYMANQMLNVYDPTNYSENPPLQAATAETMACMSMTSRATSMARDQAIAKARSVLTLGAQGSRHTLLSVKEIVHMITLAPGSKTIVLVSPGFGLDNGLLFDETALVDQAIRASVVISALDARGLYVIDASGDSQNRSANINSTRMKIELDRAAASEDSNVMQELAAATGGTFIHNTNDLVEGFRRLTTTAEYTYLLGFIPEKLKPDGSFHALKVKLDKKELTAQARSGYYAPKK